MPLSLHQIFASVWSGWLATWPTQLIALIWIGWLVSWTLGSFWAARTVKRPLTWRARAHRLPIIIGGLLLTPWIAQILGERPLWNAGNGVTYALAIVVLAGVLFTWWARIHLGRLWSSSVGRKADHRVVDTGPYGIVRHPIYSGITLASIGTAVLRGTLTAWLGVVVMTCGWYVKARMEEEFLREELGADAYGAYERRVPMLVPLLRRSKP